MHICTIIAKNYVSFARVLARSFAEHHPDGRCSVLIIDSIAGYIEPAAEPFDVLSPADIDCPAFEAMAAIYDVLELSTAVKPWLLRHLLTQSGPEGVVYLDPDIRIFAPLTELEALTRAHGLVVNPHVVTPVPRDGLRPSEQFLMMAGTYNLGFLSIGPGSHSDRLLDWWCERLRHDCLLDPPRGYFVDQRWFDLLPGIADSFHVLRDPGYNVAYWNLHSNSIALVEGRHVAGGRPLRFFHFSGFDPDHPDRLSLHQDRIDLSREPALLELCRSYAEELRKSGFDETRRWTYDYATLPDGTRLDRPLRRLFRKAELNGGMSVAPFTPLGLQTFFRYLNEPASPEVPAGVTRLMQALYRERIDVQRAFPHIEGDDCAAFLRWVRDYGREEFSLPDTLLPPLEVNVAADPCSRPVKREPPTDHAWRAIQIMSSGPTRAGASRFGPLGEFVRRLLLRVTRPLAVYQRQVDEAIIDSIIALRESTDRRSADATIALQHAELLGHLRRQPEAISTLESIAQEAETSPSAVTSRCTASPRIPGASCNAGTAHSVVGAAGGLDAIAAEPTWMYEFELGGGVHTQTMGPELMDVHRTRAAVTEPVARAALAKAHGAASAIDLACSEGWFSHRLLEWGAQTVMGIDIRAENIRRAILVRDRLGIDPERLKLRTADVFELQPAELGMFDVVLCFGLIYHLENPVGALRIARGITRGVCIVETQLTEQMTPIRHGWGQTGQFLDQHASWAAYHEPSQLQKDHPIAAHGDVISLVPNRAALLDAMSAAGFSRCEPLIPETGNPQYVDGHRLVVAGWP